MNRTDFRRQGYERTYTPTEDGYTLAFVKDMLPPLSGMDYSTKMLRYSEFPNEIGYVFKVRNGGGDFFFGAYEKSYRAVGKRVFTKKQWFNVITMENGRVRNSCLSLVGYEWLHLFVQFMGLECLLDELDENSLERFLKNKVVMKGVLTRKITNTKDLVKAFVLSSYKLKTFCYRNMKDYLTTSLTAFVSITNLIEFTTSVDKSIELLLKGTRKARGGDKEEKEYWFDYLQTFVDLVKDAAILNIKVNPSWSYKRMKNMHSLNTDRIMLLKENTLDRSGLYDTPEFTITDPGLRVNLIDSEWACYKEASVMHHCLFTHYFWSIKRGNYAALSVESPERCTVGLRLNPKGIVEIDQIHTIYNHLVTDDTRNRIESFVTDNAAALGLLFQHRSESAKHKDFAEELPF